MPWRPDLPSSERGGQARGRPIILRRGELPNSRSSLDSELGFSSSGCASLGLKGKRPLGLFPASGCAAALDGSDWEGRLTEHVLALQYFRAAALLGVSSFASLELHQQVLQEGHYFLPCTLAQSPFPMDPFHSSPLVHSLAITSDASPFLSLH